jgi:glutaredoxin 3
LLFRLVSIHRKIKMRIFLLQFLWLAAFTAVSTLGFVPGSNAVVSSQLSRSFSSLHPGIPHPGSDNYIKHWPLWGMKRPFLDTLATTLFQLETARVDASSKMDDKGRVGEPMEWSESSSFANQFSKAVASNSLGYKFKQFVADIVAGDYDEEVVTAQVNAFIDKSYSSSTPIVLFSFSTCPFCRRAKDYLEEKGISYQAMELDDLPGNQGNEIRAVLGKKTKRTSVPSIFVRGTYIGGCNDGPGLLPLAESGELEKMLQQKI